jgi:hypothetical protein
MDTAITELLKDLVKYLGEMKAIFRTSLAHQPGA